VTVADEAALELADGTATSVRDWPVPAGTARRGAILFVHGLGEHSGRYEQLGAELAALGLAARAYDLRGHGRSGGPRGGLPRDDALLDDLRFVFSDLDRRGRAAGDTAAPLLLGHSMGGTIAAAGTTGGWIAPRALILSSPALGLLVSRPQRLAAALAWRALPDRPLPNRLPVDKLSHERAVVDAYVADALVHDRITPRLFRFLADAGAAARRDAGRITVPTLLVVAGRDALVDADGAREFAAALAPGIGTLHVYDDLFHELFNERAADRARVLADVTAWVERTLSSP
jgi:alpha-beta hydrolase superfamily lysophospholipase